MVMGPRICIVKCPKNAILQILKLRAPYSGKEQRSGDESNDQGIDERQTSDILGSDLSIIHHAVD